MRLNLDIAYKIFYVKLIQSHKIIRSVWELLKW